jgi:hypothetical protein
MRDHLIAELLDGWEYSARTGADGKLDKGEKRSQEPGIEQKR